MSELLTDADFQHAEGVEDWRVILRTAHAVYRMGGFAAGLEFVTRIGALAEAANHHPDVDLRYSAVVIRLVSHDAGALTQRDLRLAGKIQAAARALELVPDPTLAHHVEIAIDAIDRLAVAAFWRAVLGYDDGAVAGEEPDLRHPLAVGPTFWFQQMTEPRPQRTASTSM